MNLTVQCHSPISLDNNGGFHVYSLNIAKATWNSLSQPRLLDSFLYLSLEVEYRLKYISSCILLSIIFHILTFIDRRKTKINHQLWWRFLSKLQTVLSIPWFDISVLIGSYSICTWRNIHLQWETIRSNKNVCTEAFCKSGCWLNSSFSWILVKAWL